jgi:hypothetical protein
MIKSFILAALTCTIIMRSTDVYAAKQYRCAGRVQYRPCDSEAPVYRNNKRSLKLSRPIPQHPKQSRDLPEPAKIDIPVAEEHLEKVSSRDGVWKGKIAGRGEVHLELQIYTDGALHSTRYMGKVVMGKKSTPFAFKSTLPLLTSWTWRVKAYSLKYN